MSTARRRRWCRSTAAAPASRSRACAAIGEPIATTHGAACGPVSVLRHYDDVSRLVTQGGKRDGANMGVLRADHPDIRAFIHAKDDGVSAAALQHLRRRDRRVHARPPPRGETYHAASTRAPASRAAPRTRRHSSMRSRARRGLTGDPGLVFLDEINRTNPTPALGEIEATNPCGEVPLLPWEACTLGSINVARFWDAAAGDLDWDGLRETVTLGVRFLDDVVEANTFPLQEISRGRPRQPQDRPRHHGLRRPAHRRRHPVRLGGRARPRRPALARRSAQRRTRPRLLLARRRASSRTGSARSTPTRARTGRATATRRAPASPRPAPSPSSRAPPRASSRCSRSRTTAAWATARC